MNCLSFRQAPLSGLLGTWKLAVTGCTIASSTGYCLFVDVFLQKMARRMASMTVRFWRRHVVFVSMELCVVICCTNAARISFASPDVGVNGNTRMRNAHEPIRQIGVNLFSRNCSVVHVPLLDKSTCSYAEGLQRWIKVSKVPGHASGGFISVVLPSAEYSHVTCHSSLLLKTALRSRIFLCIEQISRCSSLF